MKARALIAQELSPSELTPSTFQDAVVCETGSEFRLNVLPLPMNPAFMERPTANPEGELGFMPIVSELIPEKEKELQAIVKASADRTVRILSDIWNSHLPGMSHPFKKGIPAKRWHGFSLLDSNENEVLASFGSPEGMQFYILGKPAEDEHFVGLSLAFDHERPAGDLRDRRRLRYLGLGQFKLPTSKELVRIQTGVVLSTSLDERRSTVSVFQNGTPLAEESWRTGIHYD